MQLNYIIIIILHTAIKLISSFSDWHYKPHYSHTSDYFTDRRYCV